MVHPVYRIQYYYSIISKFLPPLKPYLIIFDGKTAGWDRQDCPLKSNDKSACNTYKCIRGYDNDVFIE